MDATNAEFTKDGIMDRTPSIYGPRIDGSKIQLFSTRKAAVAAAKSYRLLTTNVRPAQTRFQIGWVVYGDFDAGYLVRQKELLG
jgi:hypothetical protein